MEKDQDSSQKVRSACEPCHERKIKCKQDSAGGPCRSCAASSRKCYYLPRIKAGRPRRSRSSKKGSVVSVSSVRTDSAQRSPRLGAKSESVEPVPPFEDSDEGASYYDGSWTQSPIEALDPYNNVFASSDQPFNQGLPPGYSGPGIGQFSAVGTLLYGSNGNGWTSEGLYPEDLHQASPFSNFYETPSLSDSNSASRSPSDCPRSESDGTMASPFATGLGLKDVGGTPNGRSRLPRLQRPAGSPRSVTNTSRRFRDLLSKCSEMEQNAELLRGPHFMVADGDTTSLSNGLLAIQQSLSAAVTLMSSVTENLAASPTSPFEFETIALRATDGISPSALTKDSSQSTHASGAAFDGATVSLLHTLALKILEISDLLCNLLCAQDLSRQQSFHHIAFLSRLENDLARLKSALDSARILEGGNHFDLFHAALGQADTTQIQVMETLQNVNFSLQSYGD